MGQPSEREAIGGPFGLAGQEPEPGPGPFTPLSCRLSPSMCVLFRNLGDEPEGLTEREALGLLHAGGFDFRPFTRSEERRARAALYRLVSRLNARLALAGAGCRVVRSGSRDERVLLLAEAGTPCARDRCCLFLAGVLQSGPLPCAEVLGHAEAAGFSLSTLRRARRRAGIRAARSGPSPRSPWMLFLPDAGCGRVKRAA
jgi:hypothetical protein